MPATRSNVLKPSESLNWIQHRKSIYPIQFEPDHEMSDEQMHHICEAAKFAPTHKLTQPWQFKAFLRSGKNAWLEMVLPVARKAWSKSMDADAVERKAEKLKFKADQSAAIVAIAMKRDPDKRVPELEEVCAVACAVQNMALHMESLGWSGYWSTGAGCNSDEVRAALHLAEEDLHLGWYFIGVASDRGKRGHRKEVKEFLDIQSH